MKKFVYIGLLSLLITACMSACERLLGQDAVEVVAGKGAVAEVP